jgi:hypothetical protein
LKAQKITFISTILTLLNFSFAENPVVQTNFTPDPAPMVYNDTVFLFTGQDEDTAPAGMGQFLMKNYLLYTSADLSNWTDHGIIASLKSFTWAPSNGAWAAQCVHRNGKFYYYISLHGKGIGVLVADSPYGPFKDPLGHPLFYHSWNDIDPTVFVDDDGQAYMYWGNPECYWVKLNSDMISLAGKIDSLVPRMRTYQEGPWFYKREGRYYLAFSSTCCSEGIGYAMSNSPTGPWTYKDTIMVDNPLSSGNQPGIFDFKGKSYTFGFNFAINASQTSIHHEKRSACLAEITYDTKGEIARIPWFGNGVPEPGVAQVGSLNPYDTVQAETICFAKGVRTEVCKDVSGKMNVDSIHNNDYIKVKGVDFKTSSPKLFEARIASTTNGGSIELRIDSLNGTKIGTCTFQSTGGWQSWVTKSCEVSEVLGKHDLFFKFTGGNGLLFNFNWWKFTLPTGIATNGNNSLKADQVRVTVDGVNSRTVKIDFIQSGLHQNIRIDLFDVKGRLLKSLVKNDLGSNSLIFRLKQSDIQAGMYLIKASINNSTVMARPICLQ